MKKDPYAYKIQKLGKKYLLLQKVALSKPEGYEVPLRPGSHRTLHRAEADRCLVCRNLSGSVSDGRIFIYMMMKRTVERMEKLQEVAEKQELLMGALSHEMRTPLTSIIGYSDTLRHVKLKDEQKERALEHINREGKRLEALSGEKCCSCWVFIRTMPYRWK